MRTRHTHDAHEGRTTPIKALNFDVITLWKIYNQAPLFNQSSINITMSNPTSTFHSNDFSSSANNATIGPEMNPTRPMHHVHTDSEPLPGARGGATAVDYSADNIEHTGTQNFNIVNTTGPDHHDQHREHHDTGYDHSTGAKGVAHAATHPQEHIQAHRQHEEPHPQPSTAQATKKPTIGDKMIGKTEQVSICHSMSNNFDAQLYFL